MTKIVDINKSVSFSTDLSNLKTKADDSDVDKSKNLFLQIL